MNSKDNLRKIAYGESGAVVMSYLTWFGFTDDFVPGGHPHMPSWEFISLFNGNPDWNEFDGSLQAVGDAAQYLCAHYISSHLAILKIPENIGIDYSDPGLRLAEQLIESLLDDAPKDRQKLIEDTFNRLFEDTKNYLSKYWNLVDALAHELIEKKKISQQDAFLIIEPLIEEADKRKARRRLRIEMI